MTDKKTNKQEKRETLKNVKVTFPTLRGIALIWIPGGGCVIHRSVIPPTMKP
jgi:hypothetical protein